MRLGWSSVCCCCYPRLDPSNESQGHSILEVSRTWTSRQLPLIVMSAAHGIIVPLLDTAEDAKKLVKSAKFPPAGNRGFGSPFPMEKFGGQSTTEYLQQANDSLLTIVQIETKEALEQVRNLIECFKPMSDH